MTIQYDGSRYKGWQKQNIKGTTVSTILTEHGKSQVEPWKEQAGLTLMVAKETSKFF